MRTHLLRTVNPSAAIEAVAPDTGNAANDEDYAPAQALAAQSPHTLLADAPASPDDNVDYYLGGYAGI